MRALKEVCGGVFKRSVRLANQGAAAYEADIAWQKLLCPFHCLDLGGAGVGYDAAILDYRRYGVYQLARLRERGVEDYHLRAAHRASQVRRLFVISAGLEGDPQRVPVARTAHYLGVTQVGSLQCKSDGHAYDSRADDCNALQSYTSRFRPRMFNCSMLIAVCP